MGTRVVNMKYDDYDIYIGRGSLYGNPFKIGPDGDRVEVIRKYREWVKTQPQIIARLKELKGKTLGCFCKPMICHGDVLAELADTVEDSNAVVRSISGGETDGTRDGHPGSGEQRTSGTTSSPEG
jgi:hypothetical protein